MNFSAPEKNRSSLNFLPPPLCNASTIFYLPPHPVNNEASLGFPGVALPNPIND